MLIGRALKGTRVVHQPDSIACSVYTSYFFVLCLLFSLLLIQVVWFHNPLGFFAVNILTQTGIPWKQRIPRNYRDCRLPRESVLQDQYNIYPEKPYKHRYLTVNSDSQRQSATISDNQRERQWQLTSFNRYGSSYYIHHTLHWRAEEEAVITGQWYPCT